MVRMPQPRAAVQVSHQVIEVGRDLWRPSSGTPAQSRVSWSMLPRKLVVLREVAVIVLILQAGTVSPGS